MTSRRNDSKPLVIILILNWNGYEDTASCLESLDSLNYPNTETVVVDNGSDDNSGQRIDEEFDVTVIFSEMNRGFAGGNNIGIEYALEQDAEYVWMLNNDILVADSDALSSLVERMEWEGSVGISTPLVREYPDVDEIWFERGWVDIETGSTGHTSDDTAGQYVEDNEYIPFCSALFSTEVFETVGLLPEEYFLYYEDVDYCTRVRRAGYTLVTDQSTEIYHGETSSTGGSLSATSTYYITRNRWLFVQKWNKSLTVHFFGTALSALLFRLARHGYNGRLGSSPAAVRGFIDGMRWDTDRGPYP